MIAGDLVLNGPEPAAAVDGIRELEADGALVVQGNTDIAVADFDYAAAFPWLTDGVPESFRSAAEWAHEASVPTGSIGSGGCRPSAASGSTTRSSSSATRHPAPRRPASTRSSTRTSRSSG